ncbi:MAG: flippase-like domain-containing protein, partial [Actinobacteria bacterium]|nr:flippase-like domain-containing protein [Actinomycetota bacterium]
MLIIFLAIIRPQTFKLYSLFKKFKRLNRLEEKFNDFRKSFFEFKNKLRYVYASIIAALAAQFIFITSYYFANLYAGINLGFGSFFFLNPIIILSSNIPVSVGGIGVRENITVVILKQFGIAESDAVIFTLVILSIIILNTLIGGIIYLFKNIFNKSRGLL